jgi:hypothetical protein
MSNETRIFKISISKPNGSIIYSTVSVQSPAGYSAALQLAESMYGGPGIKVNILA